MADRLVGAFTTDGTKVASGAIDRIPPFDPRSGDHLWVTAACWRVDPDRWMSTEAGPTFLDTENLLYVGGLGCYYCEKVYSPSLKHRRCKGSP